MSDELFLFIFLCMYLRMRVFNGCSPNVILVMFHGFLSYPINRCVPVLRQYSFQLSKRFYMIMMMMIMMVLAGRPCNSRRLYNFCKVVTANQCSIILVELHDQCLICIFFDIQPSYQLHNISCHLSGCYGNWLTSRVNSIALVSP